MADTTLVKIHALGFKVTPEQYQMLKQRSENCGVRLSVWIRGIVMQAASQKPRKGYLRIREPDGATT